MFIRTVLVYLLLVGLASAEAAVLPPDKLHIRQIFIEPETLSSQGYKTSAVWFLPDYQNSRTSYFNCTEDKPYPCQPSYSIEYQYTEVNCLIPNYFNG